MSQLFLFRGSIQDFRTFGTFDISIPAAPGLLLLDRHQRAWGRVVFSDAIESGLTGSVRRFEIVRTKALTKGNT